MGDHGSDRTVEIWRRRPGGAWRFLQHGREDHQRVWLARVADSRGGEHFGRITVGAEFVIVQVGEVPDAFTEPIVSIPPSEPRSWRSAARDDVLEGDDAL